MYPEGRQAASIGWPSSSWKSVRWYHFRQASLPENCEKVFRHVAVTASKRNYLEASNQFLTSQGAAGFKDFVHSHGEPDQPIAGSSMTATSGAFQCHSCSSAVQELRLMCRDKSF